LKEGYWVRYGQYPSFCVIVSFCAFLQRLPSLLLEL
jgi:hypothetical protein